MLILSDRKDKVSFAFSDNQNTGRMHALDSTFSLTNIFVLIETESRVQGGG